MSSHDVLIPGYELDKLIAEKVKVLGYKAIEFPANPLRPERWEWFNENNSRRVFLNHYSTDIKAAWDLVEKFKLCVVPWGGQWTATQQGQIYVDGEKNMAPTAPHAICLAALFYTTNEDN